MERLALLQDWLQQMLPGRPHDIAPASADASFRRYFRIRFADDSPTLIAMDAPPPKEDIRPWLKVNQLFRAAGVHVPEVFAQDENQGFVLMSDLGNTTYLQALNEDNAHNLYAEALGSLICLQKSSRPGVLPDYTREKLMEEMHLFPEWYLGRHKQLELNAHEKLALARSFELLLDSNLAEPQVFVHRDYHSRNLMLCPQGPGIVDFQDAVYGPLSYDLVSLFKDAYIRWDEDFVLDLLARYWETARSLELPVRENFADFFREYEWMGAQRHLKVLGIFARLYHRDGKDGYLKDIPLVLDHLRRTCERYIELKPLLRILDRADPRDVGVGYTF